MSHHTQWIPVSAEGAEQQPGFRCDGCGQVKWQAEQPDEACELCAESVPTRETFAPPADRDPAPSPTIEAPTIDLTEALSGPVPKAPQSRRARTQEDK